METEKKKEQMELLVNQIETCDREKPYLYVSYSIADGVEVYGDVLAMQKAGTNVWIDVPVNFNTGEGYNASIFSAIADKNCAGILFYLSETSMTSTQNAKEVAYARSTATQEGHGKALPVYIVELAEVAHSDYKHWVENHLGQVYGTAELNVAERANINDYREKYNSKIASAETKVDVAEIMLSEIEQTKAGVVNHAEAKADEARQAAIATLLA